MIHFLFIIDSNCSYKTKIELYVHVLRALLILHVHFSNELYIIIALNISVLCMYELV